jgi:hypothetical protein
VYYRVIGLGGAKCDQERVSLLNSLLAGEATDWFQVHVMDPARAERHNWRFVDVLIALFTRFMREASSRDARKAYDRLRFGQCADAQEFHDRLEALTRQIYNPPNDINLGERFLVGLPREIRDALIRDGFSYECHPSSY